ncbi:hypothetical protein SH501x_000857 [Pirellulaceae bacterium SH501]
MSREAKLVGAKEWVDYGDVAYYEAARRCAEGQPDAENGTEMSVLVRDTQDPEGSEAFVQVRIDYKATVLDPRCGAL